MKDDAEPAHELRRDEQASVRRTAMEKLGQGWTPRRITQPGDIDRGHNGTPIASRNHRICDHRSGRWSRTSVPQEPHSDGFLHPGAACSSGAASSSPTRPIHRGSICSHHPVTGVEALSCGCSGWAASTLQYLGQTVGSWTGSWTSRSL